jgi:hypothetical protein
MKTMCKLLVFFAAAGLIVSPAAVAGGSAKSASPAFWTYDIGGEVLGTTKLVRTKNGLTAQFKTTGLVAGHAVTLWIMFFDNPGDCQAAGACVPLPYNPMNPGAPGDIGRPGVRFDFHYAGGHIVNGRNTTLTGHLQTGETSTSGWAELVALGGPMAPPPFFVVPLTNPHGAQVILAIHSHGPAQTGQTLVEQMSSYIGGCNLPFLGDAAGFATGPGDVPALDGQCSTIQLAFHNP